MKLESIKIFNFGKFKNLTEIKIEGDIATIIGENGSGKSSVLYLIKVLLDRKTRRNGISPEWIYDISEIPLVEYIFDTKKLKEIGVVLPIDEKGKIAIKIEFILDSVDNLFYPVIYIGDIENLKYNHNQNLPFDDFIDLIHITPNLKLEPQNWIESNFKNLNTFNEIKEKIYETNKEISNINEINSFNENLNRDLIKITKAKNFEVSLEANIKLSKIGSTLGIFNKKSDNRISTHGDGYEKIISILADIKQKNLETLKIILIDELENNFFYTYQSHIIDYFQESLEENIAQIVISTHSPNIVKINSNSSITKLKRNSEVRHFLFNEITNFDYYQKELATAIFYEKILIVEGHSEKLFFEYLIKHNKYLKKLFNSSDLFILNNQGIIFEKVLLFLLNICEKVIILTDNDSWNEGYQGIKRAFKLSKIINYRKNNSNLKTLDFLANNEKNNEKISDIKNLINAEKNISWEVIENFENNNVFIQTKIGDSFEEALVLENLISKTEASELKKAKLKNLASFLDLISIKLTKEKIESSPYLFKWIKVLNE